MKIFRKSEIVVGQPFENANAHDRVMIYLDGVYFIHRYTFFANKFPNSETLKLY